MSYKIGIYTYGDTKPGYSAVRFATVEEAKLYAADLFSVWFAVREYSIDEDDSEPNYAIVEGALVHLATGEDVSKALEELKRKPVA